MGRCLFHGCTADIPSVFALRGFPIPEDIPAAEWLLEVAHGKSESELEDAGFFGTDGLPARETDSLPRLGTPTTLGASDDQAGQEASDAHVALNASRVSIITEIRELAIREVKLLARGPAIPLRLLGIGGLSLLMVSGRLGALYSFWTTLCHSHPYSTLL